MNSIAEAFIEAWERVGPVLASNPDELRARLARRRLKVFSQPLRAWCVAIRATDQRINEATAIVCPVHAIHSEAAWHPGVYEEHTIDVDSRLVRRLCAPVWVVNGGEEWSDLRRRLGCPPHALRELVRAGVLNVRYVNGLGGKGMGVKVPLVYGWQALDPCARLKKEPDPIYGMLWQFHHEQMPEGFSQTITRRPYYRREKGGEKFYGWRWVCPGCKRTAVTLYYPLATPDWAKYIGFEAEREEADARPAPLATFACEHCHKPLRFNGAKPSWSWGLLVLQYSGGLLYGHEVKRPEWWEPQRKRAYRARPKASPRRDELTRLMVQTDLSMKQIALEMGWSFKSVNSETRKVYREHGVHGREELRKKMKEGKELRLGQPEGEGSDSRVHAA